MPQFYDAAENRSLLQDYCTMILKTTNINLRQNKLAEIIADENGKPESERKVAIFLTKLLQNAQQYITEKHLGINKYTLLGVFFSYFAGFTPKGNTIFQQPEHTDFLNHSLLEPTFGHIKDLGLWTPSLIALSVHMDYMSRAEVKAAAAHNWNNIKNLPRIPNEERLLAMLATGGPFEVEPMLLSVPPEELEDANDDRPWWVKMRKF